MRLMLWGFVLALGSGWLTPVEASSQTPERIVRDKAEALFKVHRRARRALTQTARNPVFERYFGALDEPSKAELRADIERTTLRTQSYFDVDEMCLIDRQGHEIARVEGGRISEELAHDEADMVFFTPGFALPKGASLVSPVYLSEDAAGWVVAYVTPIFHAGRAEGLLHFEHPLSSLQEAVVEGLGAKQFIVAVNDEGWVIADSRNPVTYAAKPEQIDPAAYFQREILPGWDVEAIMERLDAGDKIDRYQGAYHKIGRWTLVVLEGTGAG